MDGQRAIARRMVVGLPREGLTPAWERDFSAFPPAGVIVFRRDFADLEALRQLTIHLRELARPRRLFIGIDEEGGHVSQLAGHLDVPPNATLLARGATRDEIEWVSRVTGQRLRALGVDWAFAPVADVHSQPLNPVIGPRAYGTTPAQVADCVAAAIAGFSAAGLASCLKHFPGHGDTELDSHLALPVCAADRTTLDARELAPFRATLAAADSVMSAHVVYPALDAKNPATFSRAIITDLLRGTLGFGGVCVSDALEMQGASAGRGLVETASAALEAGCDLLMFAFHDESVRRARLELADRLVDGAIDRTAFDSARPRLATFDQRRPEPTPAELAKPITSLTPPDWTQRLERIIERGLRFTGDAVPGAARAAFIAGPIEVREPAWPHGRSIADALAALGVNVRRVTSGDAGSGGADPASLESRAAEGAEVPGRAAEPTPCPAGVEVVASRRPLEPAALAALRRRCASRPTVLVGLQNDAFLDAVPEAALRVSAADATPLTRGVVVRATVARIARG